MILPNTFSIQIFLLRPSRDLQEIDSYNSACNHVTHEIIGLCWYLHDYLPESCLYAGGALIFCPTAVSASLPGLHVKYESSAPCRVIDERLAAAETTSPDSSPSSPGTPIQTPFRTPRTSGSVTHMISATAARRMKVVGYPDSSEVMRASCPSSRLTIVQTSATDRDFPLKRRQACR